MSNKSNLCFLPKFLSHPFPPFGVPVEDDLFRVAAIPNDGDGSGEERGGDAWRGEHSSNKEEVLVLALGSIGLLCYS